MKLSKIEKIVGIVLALLLLLNTLSSTFFFLGKLKMSALDWIAFNACSPTSYLYLCCFVVFLIWGKAEFMIATVLPIYFLGTLSMFVLPWTGTYLMAHVGHIIMTMNLIWALFVVLDQKNYKALAIGLLVGILIFMPYIAYVQTYNQVHAEKMARVLQQE